MASGGHDCLKALLDYKRNLITLMDKLHKELDEANATNRNYRAQIDNYTKTIKDLTLDRARQGEQMAMTIKPIGGANRVNSNKDLLIEVLYNIIYIYIY